MQPTTSLKQTAEILAGTYETQFPPDMPPSHTLLTRIISTQSQTVSADHRPSLKSPRLRYNQLFSHFQIRKRPAETTSQWLHKRIYLALRNPPPTNVHHKQIPSALLFAGQNYSCFKVQQKSP